MKVMIRFSFLKQFRIAAVIFLMLFQTAAPAFSQQLTPVAPAVAPAGDSARVGIVAAVKGKVELSRPGAVGNVVESGALIYLGDTISTDAQGQLQIMLRDETIFTIGPNSSLIIDKFVYDPATAEGELEATVVKGVFRFVTGKIARKEPEKMKVNLPAGTIGIRGTMVAGEVTGKSSLVALLGPGSNNQTDHRVGSFILSNTMGGPEDAGTSSSRTESTHVVRTGFGAQIPGPNQPPTPAFRVPDAVMTRLTNDFAAPVQPDTAAGADQSQQNQGNGSDDEDSAPQPGQRDAKDDSDSNAPQNKEGDTRGRNRADGDPQDNHKGPQGPNGPNGPQQGPAPNSPGNHAGGPMGGGFQPGMIGSVNPGDFGGFDANGMPNFREFDGGHFRDLKAIDFKNILDFVNQLAGTNFQEIPSDATKFGHLRSIDPAKDSNPVNSQLSFHYSTEDSGGTIIHTETTRADTKYNLSIDIRFDADVRKIGGGNSKITESISGIGTFEFLIPVKGFDDADGSPGTPAGFFFLNLVNQDSGVGACDGCRADIFVGLGNADANVKEGDGVNKIAVNAASTVTIKDSALPGAAVLAKTKVDIQNVERHAGLSS